MNTAFFVIFGIWALCMIGIIVVAIWEDLL